MNKRHFYIAVFAAIASLFVGCRHEDSPAVIQARAVVVMAESDLHAAEANVAGADIQSRQARAALAAAEQDPRLVAAREESARLEAAQQARWEERHRWEADSRLDATGHYLKMPQLQRIDDELSQHGGEAVRARNALGRLQGPAQAARAAVAQADMNVTGWRSQVQSRRAIVARARQILASTIAAAR